MHVHGQLSDGTKNQADGGCSLSSSSSHRMSIGCFGLLLLLLSLASLVVLILGVHLIHVPSPFFEGLLKGFACERLVIKAQRRGRKIATRSRRLCAMCRD